MFYGGCVRADFGLAGSTPGFLTLHIAATTSPCEKRQVMAPNE